MTEKSSKFIRKRTLEPLADFRTVLSSDILQRRPNVSRPPKLKRHAGKSNHRRCRAPWPSARGRAINVSEIVGIAGLVRSWHPVARDWRRARSRPRKTPGGRRMFRPAAYLKDIAKKLGVPKQCRENLRHDRIGCERFRRALWPPLQSAPGNAKAQRTLTSVST